jgi:WD40 repeat protein
VRGLTWSPDGRRLLALDGNGVVKFWDTATGQDLLALKLESAQEACVAWSADGRRLLALSGALAQVWHPMAVEADR